MEDAMEEDGRPIPLSALQHQLFCPRQCALIHIEQAWAENAYTVEGRLLHEKVDGGESGRRGKVRVARALPLLCRRLGLTGVADVVEFRATASGADDRPYPVEYKRGKPKAHRTDEVQLCAQALCLEEMFGVPVPEGALYYGEPRRRTVVALDEPLRRLTEDTAAAVRVLFETGRTPPPVYRARKCGACSLIDLCQPKRLSRPPGVAHWLAGQLAEPEA